MNLIKITHSRTSLDGEIIYVSLPLPQVREQERNIALHIRQDVKQRRDEQLHQLAAELKLEWQKAQQEKIKALEKLYLSSLRAIGEGHRQAKENVSMRLI